MVPIHYVDPAVDEDHALCGVSVVDPVVGWGDEGPVVDCPDCAVIDAAEEAANRSSIKD